MGTAQPASHGTGGQDGPATRREARLGFSGQVTWGPNSVRLVWQSGMGVTGPFCVCNNMINKSACFFKSCGYNRLCAGGVLFWDSFFFFCYAVLATYYVDCVSSHSPAHAFPNAEMIRPEPYSLVETRLLGRPSLLS